MVRVTVVRVTVGCLTKPNLTLTLTLTLTLNSYPNPRPRPSPIPHPNQEPWISATLHPPQSDESGLVRERLFGE